MTFNTVLTSYIITVTIQKDVAHKMANYIPVEMKKDKVYHMSLGYFMSQG